MPRKTEWLYVDPTDQPAGMGFGIDCMPLEGDPLTVALVRDEADVVPMMLARAQRTGAHAFGLPDGEDPSNCLRCGSGMQFASYQPCTNG